MKAKQSHIKAKFTTQVSNAYHYDKPLVSAYKIIDKSTESCIVDCRVYMSASRNASTVYCSLWVSSIKESKLPQPHINSYRSEWGLDNSVSGKGSAGGWGWDKESGAIGSAIVDANIELFGTPYPYHDDKVDFKKRAYIGGTGCHKEALLAIAYAAGYNNVIMVSM